MDEYKDFNGRTLPPSIIKYSQIPRQIPSEEEADEIDNTGVAAANSFKASFMSNFVLSMAITGSLSTLWNLINSIQLINYMSLFASKNPGNVNSFMQFVEELAKFNLFGIDFDKIIEDMMYLPERDPLSLNF